MKFQTKNKENLEGQISGKKVSRYKKSKKRQTYQNFNDIFLGELMNIG